MCSSLPVPSAGISGFKRKLQQLPDHIKVQQKEIRFLILNRKLSLARSQEPFHGDFYQRQVCHDCSSEHRPWAQAESKAAQPGAAVGHGEPVGYTEPPWGTRGAHGRHSEPVGSTAPSSTGQQQLCTCSQQTQPGLGVPAV